MEELLSVVSQLEKGGFIMFLIFLTLLLIFSYGYTIKKFLEVLERNTTRTREEFTQQRELHERVLNEERKSRDKLAQSFEQMMRELTVEIRTMNKNGNR
jgi:Tfp pilus assembly protein PilO